MQTTQQQLPGYAEELKMSLNHINACYCKKPRDCCTIPAAAKKSGNQTNSSGATEKPKKHKFVKINTKCVAQKGHGHQSNFNFSRSNSVSTPTSLTSSSTRGSSSPKSILTSSKSDVGSSFSSMNSSTSTGTELTEQRKFYEDLRARLSDDSVGLSSVNVARTTPSSYGGLSSDYSDHLVRELQKFRLQNQSDCFTVYRQNDLKMHQRSALRPSDPIWGAALPYFSGHGNLPNLYMDKRKTTKLTPYAVRQKLMRLRSECEDIKQQKPKADSKWFGAVDKSSALAFQETY